MRIKTSTGNKVSAAAKKKSVSAKTGEKKLNRKLDAFPDKIDIRDWFYQPPLCALPAQLINCDKVPAILDQGVEGACTGFALAAVVNYHLSVNGCCEPKSITAMGASPRMLYEMARKYDEWPGEKYEGSSARGTMKGWTAHGVVTRKLWADNLEGSKHFDEAKAKEALNIPAGAYYRLMHRNVRDMHAALNESGILFATLMVHDGWSYPDEDTVTYKYGDNAKKQITLPIIKRKGRAADGHAVAIVGYTREGFIIQNSWGVSWGHKGFAILPYEDWLLHASDCWVAQLGVPVNMNLWAEGFADTKAGRQRSSQQIPLEQIRPFVINIGNNGRLSDSGDYWTTQTDIENLFKSIEATATNWQKKRVMLFLHGGLNSEKEVAARIVSYKQTCLDNNIYPVHIMWETDFWTSLKDEVFDIFSNDDRASAGWLNKLREGTIEIMDRTFELTASKPGTMLWDEMKENAALACAGDRAMDIVATEALKAFDRTDVANKQNWEIHIVAHSAGSIFTAYAIDKLLEIGVPIKSVQFMAPAITIKLFKDKLLPLIENNSCPQPVMYVLSESAEKDDSVGPYKKSLLWLVSNSFEEKRNTPILGMQYYINNDDEMAGLFKTGDNLIIATGKNTGNTFKPDTSMSETHGGFDNDPYTMNSVMFRILGENPKKLFEERDLQF